jgi:hypothetical protein
MKTMKIYRPILVSCLLLFLASLGINAQTIEPQDGTIMFNDNLRSCLVVNLDPEPNTLKVAWRDYLKDNYNLKLEGIGLFQSKDLLFAENVRIDKISTYSMNFYTQIIENENGSEMKLFASFGYDVFIDQANKPEEYKLLDEMLESFLKVYLPKYYTQEVNDTKKRIIDLTVENNKLNDEINSNKEKMEVLKQEIEELNKKTDSNTITLELNKKKLVTREEKLLRIKNQLSNL